MNPVDGLLSSLENLLRSSAAVQIAEALGSAPSSPFSDTPSADAYAATLPSSQPTVQTPLGLKLPTVAIGQIDPETAQSLLQNMVSNGASTPAFSGAVTMALKQMLGPLPGVVASQQGFADEDAVRLLGSPSPPDRLSDKKVPLSQQLIATAARSDLFEGEKSPAQANRGPDDAKAELARQATSANDRGEAPAEQTNAADKRRDADLTARTTNLATTAIDMERTGIIASSLLNAVMIPGWPYQNAAAAGMAAADQKFSEEEALAYLANLGANEELLQKLRKRKPNVRKKLLIHLAALLTALETVANAVTAELVALLGAEKQLTDGRAAANPRGRSDSRRRLYVE